jgi:N6-L-threonylcarbamoyladenine synthase
MSLMEYRHNLGIDRSQLPLIMPPASLCTDNGVMIAWAGIEKLGLGISDSLEDHEPVPRWPLGELIMK